MLRKKHKTTTVLSLVFAMLTTLLIAGCDSETETRETTNNAAIQQSASPAETSPTKAPISETESIETESNEAESENPERIPEDRLAEWDFGKLVAETTSPEWGDEVERMNRFLDSLGDEELKTAYQKAYALFMISYRSCDDIINRTLLTEYYGKNFYSDAPKVKMADGRDMHPSGYLYEGYENAFFDTFTSDRANAFLVSFAIIAARDGKELVYEVASNTRHCSPEYEVLSRTEDEIVIRETCYEEDLEGNRLDTILYINDNRFVKEDGTWKCADFETKQSAAERIPEERLAEWDLEKAVANATDPKGDEAVGRMNRFLDELGDEELKKTYQKAYTLFTVGDRERKNLDNSELLTEYYGEYFYSKAPHVMTEDGYILHPSGYLYEDYESAVFNTFTSDRAEAFLKENRNIAARDGKELLYEAASNTRNCSPEYEILSRTENEIVIRETCYETDAEGNRLDPILYVNDNRFVKEDGAWKCAAFEMKNADF